jgi:hypothetical protein
MQLFQSTLANLITQTEPEVTKVNANPYETNVTEYTPPVSETINLLPDEVNTVAETESDARAANERAQQRAARERSRYGVQQTAVEAQESSKLGQIQGQANIAGARTQAIRSDEAINQQLNRENIGLLSQNFQSALSNLLGLGDIDVQRKNAYANAKAASRSQHYGFLGNIGSALGSFLGGKI